MHKKILYTLICIFCLIGCTDQTKVQSIHLDPSELTLNIGETHQIEMLIEPISAIIHNPTSWQSSDPNVAQVDNNGNVTAIYAGECIITGKTKYHEAYCQITVVAPEYNLAFTNGIIFDEGIKYETNQRNLILRLYDNNLTIDSTGSMSGNGLFLNINLYAPVDSKKLPIGTYLIANTINDFTIQPGALQQDGNTYYATGSYLGQYTDNGLSALFLTKGQITIESNNKYSIDCSFIGAQTEKIYATFNGSIDIYDTSRENQTTIIEYTNVVTEPIELPEEPTLNHIKISLSNNDTIVTFVARTPKSISTLPQGNYYLSNDLQAYTLIPQQSILITPNDTIAINTATLKIEANEYTATFSDVNSIKYSLHSAEKQKNVRKQKLNSFVY